MKLSVVIPVHNAEKYLPNCLDSVLGQSMKDLEVICVDDASKDGSVSVIEEYCRKDSRVRLIKNKENIFAGQCRNMGIEAAKGTYIHFLDSDDMVAEGAYEKYWKLVEKYDADVIKGRGVCFDNETGTLCETSPLLALTEVSSKDMEKPFSFKENPELLSHVSVVPWNGIYRRSLLMDKKIRFNHLVCVNDRSFFNEVTMTAEKILLTHKPIVWYRVNNGQSLMGRRARNFSCQFTSYEIVCQQCEKYGVSDVEKRIVLDRELADVFLWYRRYRLIPEIKKEIEEQMKMFSLELDLGPFGEEVTKMRWYRTYLMASGKESLYRKVGRKVKKYLEKFI